MVCTILCVHVCPFVYMYEASMGLPSSTPNNHHTIIHHQDHLQPDFPQLCLSCHIDNSPNSPIADIRASSPCSQQPAACSLLGCIGTISSTPVAEEMREVVVAVVHPVAHVGSFQRFLLSFLRRICVRRLSGRSISPFARVALYLFGLVLTVWDCDWPAASLA